MGKIVGQTVSLVLVRQLVKEKKNSEFKPFKLLLKIDLVSHPAEWLVYIYIYIYIYNLVVFHRIRWWRLCFTTYLWTWRWLRSPRGTESLTVGALEVSCCRGCSAVSLSGSSEFLASSVFEVSSSSVNRGSPFRSVIGISLQVSRIEVALLEIGFDRVFIPQFWSTLVSFAGLEFPVHQASRHPTLLHSNHVSNLSKLGLDDGGLSAGGLSLIEDL